MKNHINNEFGVYYYSTTQHIRKSGLEDYSYHSYKVNVLKSEDRTGFVIIISDIENDEIVEVIESARFDCDNDRQTNFYGRENKRQAVVFWTLPIIVGIAKTNVSGSDLLINIFGEELSRSMEPTADNALEFLNSSAPFIRENGYNQEDLWGRMRYCVIQYILRYHNNAKNRIDFVSSIESSSRVDHSDLFKSYLADTLRMVSEECDRCARMMVHFEKIGDKRQFHIYEHNVAMLSSVNMLMLMLLD